MENPAEDWILHFTPDQLRLIADANNHYRQYLQARKDEASHAGWMRWRESQGRK